MKSVLEEEKERSCAYSGCKRAFDSHKDKIYCSDQCRNAAGREKKKVSKWQEPKHFGQINRIILRNYQILKRLYNEMLTPIKNWQLSDEGFEFKFMTGIYRLDEGIEIFMCYEYGWYQLPENKVRISLFLHYFLQVWQMFQESSLSKLPYESVIPLCCGFIKPIYDFRFTPS